MAAAAIAVAACAGQTITTTRQSPQQSFAPGRSQISVAVSTTEPIAVDPTPAPTPMIIPTPLPVDSRTMLFSGDVLSHTPVIAKAAFYGDESGWEYDYRPMFDDVRPLLAAVDLAICVLETPVSTDNIGLDGYPTFEAPTELAASLVDAGYDGCATASNHSMDRGAGGVIDTLDMMDDAGLGHAGMSRSEADSLSPKVYDLDGLRVAHLSWTYGLNGFVLPEGQPWLVNVNDVAAIADEAARARAGGADLVILSIQWGNEYQRNPSSEQLRLAAELTTRADLDAIVGNHAHVVQPIAEMNGVPIVYGLGNSLSNQYDRLGRSGTQDGLMVVVEATGNAELGWSIAGVDAVQVVPTWVDRNTYRVVDVAKALDEQGLDDGTRAVLQASFDRTIDAIELLGASPAIFERPL